MYQYSPIAEPIQFVVPENVAVIGELLPAGHRQAVTTVCPVLAVTVFAAQAVHVEFDEAPTAVEYVLAW
jgi:hypothetical protein